MRSKQHNNAANPLRGRPKFKGLTIENGLFVLVQAHHLKQLSVYVHVCEAF